MGWLYNCVNRWLNLQKKRKRKKKNWWSGISKLQAFSLDFNLRAHMKTHSLENYHVCPYPECGKRYTNECKLRTHIKTQHEKVRLLLLTFLLLSLPIGNVLKLKNCPVAFYLQYGRVDKYAVKFFFLKTFGSHWDITLWIW